MTLKVKGTEFIHVTKTRTLSRTLKFIKEGIKDEKIKDIKENQNLVQNHVKRTEIILKNVNEDQIVILPKNSTKLEGL